GRPDGAVHGDGHVPADEVRTDGGPEEGGDGSRIRVDRFGAGVLVDVDVDLGEAVGDRFAPQVGAGAEPVDAVRSPDPVGGGGERPGRAGEERLVETVAVVGDRDAGGGVTATVGGDVHADRVGITGAAVEGRAPLHLPGDVDAEQVGE